VDVRLLKVGDGADKPHLPVKQSVITHYAVGYRVGKSESVVPPCGILGSHQCPDKQLLALVGGDSPLKQVFDTHACPRSARRQRLVDVVESFRKELRYETVSNSIDRRQKARGKYESRLACAKKTAVTPLARSILMPVARSTVTPAPWARRCPR
jgi:hypothetical protein